MRDNTEPHNADRGYADIMPIDPLARSLANLESVIGQFLPRHHLARLVTLELEDRRR
jgi:hypothetical protein